MARPQELHFLEAREYCFKQSCQANMNTKHPSRDHQAEGQSRKHCWSPVTVHVCVGCSNCSQVLSLQPQDFTTKRLSSTDISLGFLQVTAGALHPS